MGVYKYLCWFIKHKLVFRDYNRKGYRYNYKRNESNVSKSKELKISDKEKEKSVYNDSIYLKIAINKFFNTDKYLNKVEFEKDNDDEEYIFITSNGLIDLIKKVSLELDDKVSKSKGVESLVKNSVSNDELYTPLTGVYRKNDDVITSNIKRHLKNTVMALKVSGIYVGVSKNPDNDKLDGNFFISFFCNNSSEGVNNFKVYYKLIKASNFINNLNVLPYDEYKKALENKSTLINSKLKDIMKKNNIYLSVDLGDNFLRFMTDYEGYRLMKGDVATVIKNDNICILKKSKNTSGVNNYFYSITDFIKQFV